MKLLGKIFINGQINVLTGLAIGGSTDDLTIGGVHNTVVKTSEGVPFIPGSSLKGKLRSLQEKYRKNSKICNCGEIKCPVCTIFGVAADKSHDAGPTRLYVRDAFLDKDIQKQMKEKKGKFVDLGLEYTEDKSENTIDRLTSSASPRQMERVPAGAVFNFNMVYNIFDTEKDIDNLNVLIATLWMLEDDYLGSSGTRGYGQIEFKNIEIGLKTLKTYEENNQAKILVSESEEIDFDDIKEKINEEISK